MCYTKPMTRTTSGFTIIELLVVITVIGILSQIGIANFGRYQTSTADSQRSSKAVVISEALEKFYDKNGEYPGCTAVTGAASVVTTTVLPGVDVLALLTPKSAAGDTNSIKCLDLTGAAGEADIFAYVGNSDTTCTTGAACEQFTLKYKEEATGTIKSITSRRYPAVLPTPTAPTVAAATPATTTTYSWSATTCAVGTVKYQYSYSGGYTAGWSAPTTSLSTTLDTSGLGLTYTISVQAKCTAVNAASPWSASGQASYYRSTVIADNFNRTAASLGGTSTGGFPWTALSGTWSTNGTMATTPAVNSSNPLATINYGSANVDASVGVSSGGGDALYLRVTDATNWIRARVRSWTTSVSTYYPSSYYVDTSYYTGGSYYGSGWGNNIGRFCENAASGYPATGNYYWNYLNGVAQNLDKHMGIGSGGCMYYWDKNGVGGNTGGAANSYGQGFEIIEYAQTVLQNPGYWTYGGYWVDNSYWATTNTPHYTVILEKSVAGVITTLGTSAELAAPTSLRLRAVGTSIGVFTNGGATAVVNATEGSFTTIGKHGIGRGLSDNDGQGLDNFTIDAL